MREMIYLLTASADGYIADKDGSVSWMSGAPSEDYGFNQFYHEIDLIVMGKNTFDHLTRLAKGTGFAYPDKQVIVVTKQTQKEPLLENVTFLAPDEAAKAVAREKIAKDKGPIWLAGGGQTAAFFTELQFLDEIRMYIQPIFLGSGTPVISELSHSYPLATEDAKVLAGGIVELRYRTVKSWRSDK